jgi:hypothetical protein
MDENARALRRHALGDHAADAIGRSRDQHGLAGELHGFIPFGKLDIAIIDRVLGRRKTTMPMTMPSRQAP